MTQMFRPLPGAPTYRAPRLGTSAAGYFPQQQQPQPIQQDDSTQREAARKARVAADKAVGRSATILTDYAMATQTPSVLKPTLGA